MPSELKLRNVMKRSQTQLESQFRLAFNMILNLLRQDDVEVQDAIKKSFSQNFVQQKAPGQKNQLAESTRRRRRMRPTDDRRYVLERLPWLLCLISHTIRYSLIHSLTESLTHSLSRVLESNSSVVEEHYTHSLTHPLIHNSPIYHSLSSVCSRVTVV